MTTSLDTTTEVVRSAYRAYRRANKEQINRDKRLRRIANIQAYRKTEKARRDRCIDSVRELSRACWERMSREDKDKINARKRRWRAAKKEAAQ